MDKRTCTIEDCEREFQAHGWCDLHYRRMKRTGTTDLPIKATLEMKAAKRRRSRAADPEKTVELARRYREANPWLIRSLNAMTDARRRAPNAHVEFVDLEAVLTEHGLTCHICADPISDAAAVEFDHVIPLAVGGDHIRANLRPSHKLCNVRKGSKLNAPSDPEPSVAAS